MINEIIYKKVGEWEPKGFRQPLINRIQAWLNQFDEEEKPEMLILLSYFDYYSKCSLDKEAVILYQNFRKQCSDSDIAFVPIEKDLGTSFSDLFFTSFWLNNNLYDFASNNSLSAIDEEGFPQTIVIVDDFYGTGETVIAFLNKLIKKSTSIKKKTLYFISIHGTDFGQERIENFAKNEGICLKIISNKCTKKAFSYDYIYPIDCADSHKDKYINIYKKREYPETFALGYNQSEALVSFYYNTPNNTLGLFWQKLDGFFALFKRHKKERTSLNELKKKRKTTIQLKQISPTIQPLEAEELDSFMVYCLSKGNSFDIYEACEDFGLTEKQITKRLDSLLGKGYLVYESGRFTATNLLKEHVSASRIKRIKSIYSGTTKSAGIETNDNYLPKNFKNEFSGYKKGGEQ